MGNVVSAMEQLGTCLRELATPMGSYMRALVEEGFERDEAMCLVMDLQKSMAGHHCVFCQFGTNNHDHDDEEEIEA